MDSYSLRLLPRLAPTLKRPSFAPLNSSPKTLKMAPERLAEALHQRPRMVVILKDSPISHPLPKVDALAKRDEWRETERKKDDLERWNDLQNQQPQSLLSLFLVQSLPISLLSFVVKKSIFPISLLSHHASPQSLLSPSSNPLLYSFLKAFHPKCWYHSFVTSKWWSILTARSQKNKKSQIKTFREKPLSV